MGPRSAPTSLIATRCPCRHPWLCCPRPSPWSGIDGAESESYAKAKFDQRTTIARQQYRRRFSLRNCRESANRRAGTQRYGTAFWRDVDAPYAAAEAAALHWAGFQVIRGPAGINGSRCIQDALMAARLLTAAGGRMPATSDRIGLSYDILSIANYRGGLQSWPCELDLISAPQPSEFGARDRTLGWSNKEERTMSLRHWPRATSGKVALRASVAWSGSDKSAATLTAHAHDACSKLRPNRARVADQSPSSRQSHHTT